MGSAAACRSPLVGFSARTAPAGENSSPLGRAAREDEPVGPLRRQAAGARLGHGRHARIVPARRDARRCSSPPSGSAKDSGSARRRPRAPATSDYCARAPTGAAPAAAARLRTALIGRATASSDFARRLDAEQDLDDPAERHDHAADHERDRDVRVRAGLDQLAERPRRGDRDAGAASRRRARSPSRASPSGRSRSPSDTRPTHRPRRRRSRSTSRPSASSPTSEPLVEQPRRHEQDRARERGTSPRS